MSSGPGAGEGGGGAPLTGLGPGSLVSFLGGMGAWSAWAGAGGGPGDGAGSAAPKGPRGSAAWSTDCSTVDWASTFLAGAFLPPGGRLVVLGVVVVLVVVLGVDEDAGVEVAGGSCVAVATVQLVIPFGQAGRLALTWRVVVFLAARVGLGGNICPVASQHPCIFHTPTGSTHRPKDGRPCWIMQQRLGVTRVPTTARDCGCGDVLLRWCGGGDGALP